MSARSFVNAIPGLKHNMQGTIILMGKKGLGRVLKKFSQSREKD
jgi:hypothetical protein